MCTRERRRHMGFAVSAVGPGSVPMIFVTYLRLMPGSVEPRERTPPTDTFSTMSIVRLTVSARIEASRVVPARPCSVRVVCTAAFSAESRADANEETGRIPITALLPTMARRTAICAGAIIRQSRRAPQSQVTKLSCLRAPGPNGDSYASVCLRPFLVSRVTELTISSSENRHCLATLEAFRKRVRTPLRPHL